MLICIYLSSTGWQIDFISHAKLDWLVAIPRSQYWNRAGTWGFVQLSTYTIRIVVHEKKHKIVDILFNKYLPNIWPHVYQIFSIFY